EPKPEPDDESSKFIKEYKNLSYGKSTSQVIDLIFPDVPANITTPVNAILLIHGGGWEGGDKNEHQWTAYKFSTNRYFVAASMNYRMFGEGANCDDMLADVHSAIELIKSKANAVGVTVHKIILMGISAGAHLSLLYTYKNHSISPIPISFCIGQSSPTDFTDLSYYEKQTLTYYMLQCASSLTGKEITVDNYQQNTGTLLSISPIHYIKSNVPPTLLAHGAKDEIVPLSNATRLYNALTKINAVANLFIYSNSGHGLDNDPGTDSKFDAKMEEYIKLYAK
ncbi:MAG: alpha/beta hydrolase, partial [Bacteroidales bacterium]|nr:alpha/beta hydrolase [Bacteroidales bacterium]